MSGYIFATKARIDSRKKLVKQQYVLHMSHNMVNFGPLAAEIGLPVWGTPANFDGFRVLAALLHGSQVVSVRTEGATYVRQGDHHVGHWPTFLVETNILNVTQTRQYLSKIHAALHSANRKHEHAYYRIKMTVFYGKIDIQFARKLHRIWHNQCLTGMRNFRKKYLKYRFPPLLTYCVKRENKKYDWRVCTRRRQLRFLSRLLKSDRHSQIRTIV